MWSAEQKLVVVAKNLICHKNYCKILRKNMHTSWKFMHILVALLCTKTKLKSIKPIYQWTHLFMESKNSLFHVCIANNLWVIGTYLWCSRMKLIIIVLAIFLVHMEECKESTIPWWICLFMVNILSKVPSPYPVSILHYNQLFKHLQFIFHIVAV